MKRFLTLLLALVMAFFTIGCSTKTPDNNGGTNNGTTNEGTNGGTNGDTNSTGNPSIDVNVSDGAAAGGTQSGGATSGGSTGGGSDGGSGGGSNVPGDDSNTSENETVTKGELMLSGTEYSIQYAADNASADIVVDFGTPDGTRSQNVKKIDLFTPTWNFGQSLGLNEESMDMFQFISQFKAEALRFDMMFGNGGIASTYEVNQGIMDSNTGLMIDSGWQKINGLGDALYDANVLPYFIMVGIPQKYQDLSWNHSPTESYYTEFCQNVTKYFKANNRRVIYETWNEPDLNGTDYWSSGNEAFFTYSTRAAASYKWGDFDAYVVECGLCYPIRTLPSLWSHYVNQTKSHNNHIDAFSWHFYGDQKGNLVYGSDGTFDQVTSQMRNYYINQANGYDFHSTTTHISEFSLTSTISKPYSTQSQVSFIPKMYSTFDRLLRATDISRIQWACWMLSSATDTGFSIIDPFSFRKNPVYYTLWSNGRLPLVPVKVTNSKTSDFSVRTGVDSHRAAAVIINNNLNEDGYLDNAALGYKSKGNKRSATVELKNIPFNAKNAKIYLVDANHFSYLTSDDKPYLIMDLPETQVKQGTMKFNITVPENAAFHIEISDGTWQDDNGNVYAWDGKNTGELVCETDIESNLSDYIVRKDYYYDTWADDKPYSDIYETSFDVSLGMFNNATGKTAINVTLDGLKGGKKTIYDEELPAINNLQLDWNAYGLNGGSDKGFGVRVDYHTASGYTSPKYYYYGDYNNCFWYKFDTSSLAQGKTFNDYSWGTNAAVATSEGTSFGSTQTGRYTIPLAANAPAGWDGRIQLTYYMINCGSGAAATLKTVGL